MITKAMKRVLFMSAIALAAAACGSTATDTTGGNPAEAVPVGDQLPLADADGDGDGVVSAGCALGEPLCDDTVVVPNEGTDLQPVADGEPIEGPPPIEPQPEPDPGQSISSGMPANGGITVSAALATETTGILAVQGHLYDDGSGPRLCESLEGGGERYICGGANVQVKGLDSESLVYHEDYAYTEETVVLFGSLDSGILTIDSLVTG
jgi:hypothetical protein